MNYIRIKNLEKFQHYKHRSPPWIRLHRSVLRDHAFGRLQDASKAHLMMLWLLATEYENKVPADLGWLGSILCTTEPINLDELVSAGFIEPCDDAGNALASRTQNVTTEKSRVEKSRVEKYTGESEKTEELANPESASLLDDLFAAQASPAEQASEPINPDETLFELAWQEYPERAGGNSKHDGRKAFLARLKAGASPDDLLGGLRRYAAYCEAMGMVGTQYVKQAATFFGPGEHYMADFAIPPSKQAKPAPQQFAYQPTTELPAFLRGSREIPPNPDPGF